MRVFRIVQIWTWKEWNTSSILNYLNINLKCTFLFYNKFDEHFYMLQNNLQIVVPSRIFHPGRFLIVLPICRMLLRNKFFLRWNTYDLFLVVVYFACENKNIEVTYEIIDKEHRTDA